MTRQVGGFSVDLKPFEAFLRLMDKNVNKDAREALKTAAKRIALDARHNSPVLHYRLENTIKMQPVVANQFHMRIKITVGGMYNGVNVSKYAVRVHEMAWENRGPLTRAKGPKAGPRYLTRAIRDNQKDTIAAVEAAMGTAIKDAARTSGVSRKRTKR